MCRTTGSSAVLFLGDEAMTSFCWTILAISRSTSFEGCDLRCDGVLGVMLTVSRAAATLPDGDVFAPFYFHVMAKGREGVNERNTNGQIWRHYTFLMFLIDFPDYIFWFMHMRQTDSKIPRSVDSLQTSLHNKASNPFTGPDWNI